MHPTIRSIVILGCALLAFVVAFWVIERQVTSTAPGSAGQREEPTGPIAIELLREGTDTVKVNVDDRPRHNFTNEKDPEAVDALAACIQERMEQAATDGSLGSGARAVGPTVWSVDRVEGGLDLELRIKEIVKVCFEEVR